MPVTKTSNHKSKHPGRLPKILILTGIVILMAVVFLLKNQPVQTTASGHESPEVLLDRYLAEGKPTFAFFHSTNCHSCIVMMDTVAQVFPQYQDSVSLVDVDVYDPQNDNLLRRAGITSIPTLVFFNRQGQGKVSIGVMEADALRQELSALKEMP